MSKLVFFCISLFFAHHIKSLQFEERYYEPAPVNETRIAVIVLEGHLDSDMSENFADQLVSAYKDSSIRAIVLKITSPGGSAGVSSALYQVIKELKKDGDKLIVAWVDDICASGAYYIAAATDWIICAPGAIIGSIGVIYETWRFKKLIQQFNIEHDVFHAGNFKAIGNPYTDMTEEHKAYLELLLDTAYRTFRDDVRSCRAQLVEDYTIWAEGKIFQGTEALKIGLVDQVGAQLAVKQFLTEKLDLDGFIRWVHAPQAREVVDMRSVPRPESKNAGTSQGLVAELVSSLLCELGAKRAGLRMEYLP